MTDFFFNSSKNASELSSFVSLKTIVTYANTFVKADAQRADERGRIIVLVYLINCFIKRNC